MRAGLSQKIAVTMGLAWVTCGFSGFALAQSLLSEPAARLPARTEASKPLPQAKFGDLDTWISQAEKGQGKAVHPYLADALQNLLAQSQPNEKDLARVMVYTLLAGEELEPPFRQERLARQFLDRFPKHSQASMAYYTLLLARWRQGKPFDLQFTENLKPLEGLPPWMQTRILLMEAEVAKEQAEFGTAARLLVLEHNGSSTLNTVTKEEVLSVLSRVWRMDDLEAFFKAHHQGWLEDERKNLEARVLLNAGLMEQAIQAVAQLQKDKQVKSPLDRRMLTEAQQEIEAAGHTHPERIGVLLPLGSANQAIQEMAWDILDGLRMQVQFTAQAGALPFELVVKDTINQPERAGRLVEELVRQDQVSAIIGPLARAEAEVAMRKAEELKVPLLSLSLTATLPPGSEYAFRNSMARQDEIRDLVRYAMDYSQAKKFVIVYPNSPFGHDMMAMFWDEVNRRGGHVVGAASYQPWGNRGERENVGLQEVFDHLTGTDRFQSKEERALMEKAGERRSDPVVDFDAIYVPVDTGGIPDLRLIASYPTTVDAEHTPLFGSRDWNADEVLVTSGGKLDGAVFVDSFDRTQDSKPYVNFRRRHRNLFGFRTGYRSPSYFTAIGYDSAGLLMQLLSDPKTRTRRRMAIALKSMTGYAGLTGLTRFHQNGEGQKESLVFRIDGERTTKVLP